MDFSVSRTLSATSLGSVVLVLQVVAGTMESTVPPNAFRGEICDIEELSWTGWLSQGAGGGESVQLCLRAFGVSISKREALTKVKSSVASFTRG